MKGFLISDIHIGVHPLDEDRWLGIADEYFTEFFIPLLKKEYKKGDKVFILGDLFHNRNHISLKAITFTLNLFEKLETLGIEIKLIIGNHDMYNSSDYDHISPRILTKFSNVDIIDSVTTLDTDDIKILMMPWINSHKEELKILRDYTGTVDYLMCHSDLSGAKTNMKVKLMSDITVSDFKGFPKVYAGHIHIRQTISNFTFIGSPYHMDRNDTGNRKGIYVIDFATGKEQFYENHISPVYREYIITPDTSPDVIDSIAGSKDFIDVAVHESLLKDNKEIRRKIETITRNKQISSLSTINDSELITEDADISDADISDVESIIINHLQKQKVDDKKKIKMMSVLNECIDTAKEKLKK